MACVKASPLAAIITRRDAILFNGYLLAIFTTRAFTGLRVLVQV